MHVLKIEQFFFDSLDHVEYLKITNAQILQLESMEVCR
jgi:hypothetical protein